MTFSVPGSGITSYAGPLPLHIAALPHIFSLTERCFSVSVATNKRNACQSKPTANLHELWLCHALPMGCG